VETDGLGKQDVSSGLLVTAAAALITLEGLEPHMQSTVARLRVARSEHVLLSIDRFLAQADENIEELWPILRARELLTERLAKLQAHPP